MARNKNICDDEAAGVGQAVAHADVDALSCVEKARKAFTKTTSRTDRSAIGQFLTAAPIARFMASLFERDAPVVRILDPGAGTGALFAALTERLISRPHRPRSIEVLAYETDQNIVSHLEATVGLCRELCA